MSAFQKLCPCCSGKTYVTCCQKFHQGALPENALVLMRSRYSAYALGIASYLIETTHSQSLNFLLDKKQWLDQIQGFCHQVSFEKLEILETQTIDEEAFVAFVAHLSQAGKDLTFTEKSRFLKEGQVWKYIDGKIAKGCLTITQLKKL